MGPVTFSSSLARFPLCQPLTALLGRQPPDVQRRSVWEVREVPKYGQFSPVASNATHRTSNSRVCMTRPELSSLSYRSFYPGVNAPSPLGSHTGCTTAGDGLTLHIGSSPSMSHLIQGPSTPRDLLRIPGNHLCTSLSYPGSFLILIKF